MLFCCCSEIEKLQEYRKSPCLVYSLFLHMCAGFYDPLGLLGVNFVADSPP